MGIRIDVSLLSYKYTNGQQIVEVSGTTVGECLGDLVKQFPRIKEALFMADEKLNEYLDIYVNQESTYPEVLAKPVRDGDELYIVPIISGG